MSLWLYAVVGAEAVRGLADPTALHRPAGPAEERTLPAAGHGVTGEPLTAVFSGEIAAVAGEVVTPPVACEASLRAQDAVVRRLADALPAVLPARYGQAAADAADLRRLLAGRRAELAAALARVAGCAQMTVRLARRSEAANGPGGGEESPQTALDSPLAQGTSAPGPVAPGSATPGDAGEADPAAADRGRRHLAARRAALRAAGELPEVRELRRAVGELVVAERVEAAADGSLITAYHLVAREHTGDYATRLAAAAAAGRPRARCSGPWPPYAFAPGLAG